MNSSFYSILEVSRKYDIKAHTLKFYEQEGLIKSVRNQSNYRMYDEGTLRILEQVLLFRKMGISLKKIKMIFATNNQHEIVQIIANHKDQLKHEISALSSINDRVSAFLTQVEHHTVAAERVLERCIPARITEIALPEMRETSGGGGAAAGGQPEVRPGGETPGGAAELSISGNDKYAVTEKEYAIPFMVHARAKTSGQSICLSFGGYRAEFKWESADQMKLIFHDHVYQCNLMVNAVQAIPQETFLSIKWVLEKDKTIIYADGTMIFTLYYTNNYDYALSSRIGISAAPGDTVTLSALYAVRDNTDTEVISLPSMIWRQSEYYMKNNELVFYTLFDRAAVRTAEQFSMPLKIDLTARIDDTNLRLYYHNGHVILNWEMNKMLLHIEDVVDGTPYTVDSAGYITPNEYHDISWILHSEFTALLIDGAIRFYSEDAPCLQYAGNGGITDAVRIGSAFGSTVFVKRLTVTELKI